ncbi:hypothetical protein SAMN05421505_110104 [Sinosporangium album]|uniref:Uncharacterized protein n=1 Tax=Sinosporangium album TaxID=504805 RepID=A0A1G7YZ82_9ACTN|nr:hypothetical protein [Sinosporangium album]SDH01190.1 hypothetical protein SAMN05421505_110104 [Sinosporangium album]
MAGFDIHFQALKNCGSAVYRLAKDFDQGYGQLKPAPRTDAALFGELEGGDALAAQIKSLEEGLIKKEFSDAAEKLRAVENALDQVEANVRAANRAAGGDK